MHSIDWFPRPRTRPADGGLAGAALKAAAGAGAAALFYLRGLHALAAVAAGLAALFFAVSLSAKGRAALGQAFAVAGEWLGRAVGTVLLSAIFLLVMTPARALRRLAGADDLQLRDRRRPSYWLPCDSEEHKRRFAGAMFATEVRPEPGGRRWIGLAVAAVVLLAGAEITLRAKGYGHPPVYVSDPSTGYHLAPDQKTTWRGARFETNQAGMRSPHRDPAKAPGTLRVLTLSTDGGLRVDQDALLGRALERTLAAKADGHAAGPAEVWNADVDGWGPASMRGFVERFGTFDADVAVLAIAPGGLEQPKQSLLFTPHCPAGKPPRLALEEELIDLLWHYRKDRTPAEPEYTRTLRGMGAAELGGLARALHDRNVEALLVIAAPIEPLAAEDRAPFLQAVEAVERAGGRALTLPASFAEAGIDAASGALTPAGHAALAATIAEDLLAHSPRARAWAQAGAKAP